MDIVSLIIIIGVVTSIVGSFKNTAKKADNKSRERRNASKGSILNKIPFEKLETYVGEDVVNEFKGYVGYKENRNIENNMEFKSSYEEPLPKKTVKKKKKKPSRNVDNIYASEKIVQEKSNDVFLNKKSEKRKKNPFEFTKNPVTNAIIAAEILGKPKCKK